MSRSVETRDFSRQRPRIEFTLDGEVFKCHSALPLAKLQRVILDIKSDESGNKIDVSEENVVDKLLAVMKIFMKKESFRRFALKMDPPEDENSDDDNDDDDKEPVDHTQLMDIITWLLEKHALRPTEPSSPSSTGSSRDDGGTPSAAGASVAESILST